MGSHAEKTSGSPTVSEPGLPLSATNESAGFDGGPRAWATVIGGCLTVATTFGYTNSFGVYQDLYTRSHAASASAISWIGSTQLFFLMAMALPAGKLLDMGYFRQTTIVGTLIYVFSLFMVSLSHPDKYYQLYLSQGLGMGIGAGLLYVPSVAVQAHHWRARRSLAMGIVASGSSLGGIVFPIMLNHLFKDSTGFAWGVRASAFIVLGLLVAANLLMSDRPHTNSEGRVKPDLKAIMTDIPYLLCVFSGFIMGCGIFFPYFYLQLFSILHGIDPTVAFYTVAIMNAGSLPGRILPNLLADWIGPYNVAIPCIIVAAVLIFALVSIKTVAGVIVFSILYGFTSGAYLSLCGPALAVLSNSPSEVGVRFGIAFFVTAFGALMGNPIDGALLGNTFTWYKATVFSGVAALVGAAGFTAARQILVTRKGTQLV